MLSARATIEQRKASLDQASIDLDRAEIRSPIDGTVISRTVDPGQTVAASLQAPELFKIAQDLSRIRIEAQVNEADVGAVAEGNVANFTVDAYPDRQFEGRVTQVRLAATELNSVVTYTVIIEAANEGRKLFPGMTANVNIVSATREGALRIANDTLRFKPKTDGAGADRQRGEGGQGDRGGQMIDAAQDRGGTDRRAGHGGARGDGQARTRNARREPAELHRRRPAVAAIASAMRQRSMSRLEQALGPLLTDAQKVAFQRWKDGRGGHTTRDRLGARQKRRAGTAHDPNRRSPTTSSPRS